LSEAGAPALDLLLLWHMHQPDYRDRRTGEFTMPWVYLHATKDYADMAWHLERNPGLRAVVNFVPVLLEQIEDYVDQFATGRLRDPLLRLLARGEDTPLDEAEREQAFRQCFRANHHRLIAPYPAYQALFELYQAAQAKDPGRLRYLSDTYLRDLVTWYHLSWTGETVRRESEVVMGLLAKGSGFSAADRTALLQVLAGVVRGIIPRFRALAQRGQVELTTTPHDHPLAPLLLDFRSARESLPEATLPTAERYPGGRERVLAQLDEALASHERRFGSAPRGIWPAEGAVSAEFAALLAQRGIAWTASGAGVLANSLRAPAPADSAVAVDAAAAAHRAYRAPALAPGLTFFFRDDRLSDLIGFVYSKWHGRDASDNLVHELEAIAARSAGGPRPLVSIILDGENPWEYFPYNGFFFLSELYRKLSGHAAIRTVTGSEAAQAATPAGELAHLAAGSWVYGNLATWIGAPEKNRAWDLLCAAKRRYDESAGRLDPARAADAEAQLADCEASDWFWWPGDENPRESVAAFDALFRDKLASLYEILQSPVPEALSEPLGSGAGRGEAEAGGTMRRGMAG
jgi:alpha-amylase/alpha-mannosidase (GH57 family)